MPSLTVGEKECKNNELDVECVEMWTWYIHYIIMVKFWFM